MKIPMLMLPLLMVCDFLALSLSAQVNSLDAWKWRNPRPSNEFITGVTYGLGVFVAVTDAGAVFTSADGALWQGLGVQSNATLKAILLHSGLFLAVGGDFMGSSGTILTSSDGATWLPRTANWANTLWGIGAGQGHLIAVGEGGTIGISPDGTNWAAVVSGTTNTLYGIDYGKSLFVAVGEAGTICTSLDGTNWISRRSGISNSLVSVAYGNGAFVAVGPANTAITSVNGTNWTTHITGVQKTLNQVAFLINGFVAVGPGGTVLTSVDGSTWKSQATGTTRELTAVTDGEGTYVATGELGAILTSLDTASWVNHTAGTTRHLLSVTYGSGNFVAVGGSTGNDPTFPKPSPVIITSPNGANWALHSIVTNLDLYGITFANDMFVALGNSGLILTSPDAGAWTIRNAGSTSAYTNRVPYPPVGSIAYGAGMFVAASLALGNSCLISPDALTWTKSSLGQSNLLNRVRYLQGIFLGTGYDPNAGSLVLVSTNGVDWRKPSTPNLQAGKYADSAYGRGMFVIVGDNGIILTSPDTIDWSMAFVPAGQNRQNLQSVTYGGGLFVAVDDGGGVLSSTDGINWMVRRKLGRATLYDVTYGDGSFVAVGLFGSVWQSGPILTLAGLATDGGFSITLSGESGVAMNLEASSNLVNWTNVPISPNSGGLVQFLDTNSVLLPQRFYRARVP